MDNQNNQQSLEKQSIQQSPKIPQQSSSKSFQQSSIRIKLREQLLLMEFEADLIEQAVNKKDNLDDAIEYIINRLEQKEEMIFSESNEVKLVILVRMDLKMGNGKIAAQCAHVTLKAFQKSRNKAQSNSQYLSTFIQWMERGRSCIFMKIESEEQLFQVTSKAEQLGINCCHIRDAGRTQVAAGSVTVAAIGPTKQKQFQTLIAKLKPF